MNVNWPKFILLCLALVGMVSMVLVGVVDWSDVSGPFGLIIGYGTANGLGAARNQPTRDLFTPSNPHRRAGELPPPDPDS